MLGNNAIYLARQIDSWDLIHMDEKSQLDTLKKNEIIIRSFKYAMHDLSSIMYCFMDSNRKSNLYGYKMKFDAIEHIVSLLASCLTDENNIAFGMCGKSFRKIADDLEEMVKILSFEIDNNMTVIDCFEKTYKRMPKAMMV